MDRSNKSLILAIAAAFLIPLAIVLAMLAVGADPVDVTIQAVFLFTTVPILVMSVYMWMTGKGAMLIAGYNTSPKAVRDLYDSKALSKFIGMLLTVFLLITLAALEAIFLFDDMLPFWILFMVGLVVLVVGLIYANTGGRFLKEGVAPQDVSETTAAERGKTKRSRNIIIAVVAISLTITVVILLLVFTSLGPFNVNATLEAESLHVTAPMVDKNVAFDDITSVELKDSFDAGRRVGGFGGGEVSSGNFQNDEFGRYVLAQYNSVPEHIVVHHSGEVLVFNLDTSEKTIQMYEDLRSRLSEP